MAEKKFRRDVYDGQVWKDFLHYDTVPFLALAYYFAFQLWFQPFEHTVMNLPRHFLQENVILVGVIPGPTQPRGHFPREFVSSIK